MLGRTTQPLLRRALSTRRVKLPRSIMQRPHVASLPQIVDPYRPPGLGTVLPDTAQWRPYRVHLGRDWISQARLRWNDRSFSVDAFRVRALEVYIAVNELAKGDGGKKKVDPTEFVTLPMEPMLKGARKERKKGPRDVNRVWRLVDAEPIEIITYRVVDVGQGNLFAQISCRVKSQQTFAAFAKDGSVVAGDPDKVHNVEEVLVYEKLISEPEGSNWRLAGILDTKDST